MTWKDQVLIIDVVVTYSTREMVASNVINWLASAIAKLSTIAKIHKYRVL
jgi:hypothetical protein